MTEENKLIAEERKALINKTLSDMAIKAVCTGYVIGPSYTRYNIEYKKNGTLKSLSSAISDLGVRLGVPSLRFIPSVPNEPYSALEIVNVNREVITYNDIYDQLNDNPMSIPFGVDINNKLIQANLYDLPHLLLVGTTGSGKSVFLHSLISTLIKRNTPDDVRFVLIDTKYIEMLRYKELPHLARPIINKPEEGLKAFFSLVSTMEDRYELFMNEGAADIREHNKNSKTKLPYIVVVVDEYIDLVDAVEKVKAPITTLLQKARAAGIHVVLSAQRINAKALSNTMKANFGAKAAFATAMETDSIVIIDDPSAESLGSEGDMLIKSPLVSRDYLTRAQGCYIKSSEVRALVDELKEKYKNSEPLPVVPSPIIDESDENYNKVKQWLKDQEYVTLSKIQRECSLGFNRSNRVLERLQKEGLVSTELDKKKGYKVIK